MVRVDWNRSASGLRPDSTGRDSTGRGELGGWLTSVTDRNCGASCCTLASRGGLAIAGNMTSAETIETPSTGVTWLLMALSGKSWVRSLSLWQSVPPQRWSAVHPCLDLSQTPSCSQ